MSETLRDERIKRPDAISFTIGNCELQNLQRENSLSARS